MQNLQNFLPKDVVDIVEEYSKDKTKYNLIVFTLDEIIRSYHYYLLLCNRLVTNPNFKPISFLEHWNIIFKQK